MGRWAQRTRCGGTVNNFNELTAASIDSGNPGVVIATFSIPFDVALLAAADFVSQVSGEVGDSLAQLSNNVIEISFLGDITGDTEIQFNTNAVGFVTGVNVNYT